MLCTVCAHPLFQAFSALLSISVSLKEFSHNGKFLIFPSAGSGKTYSMFGAHATAAATAHPSATTSTSTYTPVAVLEGRGIVPRACEEIFTAVQQRRRQNGIDSEISVSYVEVFGDEVSDLLKRGARCGHSKVAAQQYVLSGAAERVLLSMEDVQEVLETGECQRVMLTVWVWNVSLLIAIHSFGDITVTRYDIFQSLLVDCYCC